MSAEVISQLGLTIQQEIDVKTAAGVRKVRVFRDINLSVEGREGTYDRVELPGDNDTLLGLTPLENLGLEPDLQNQRLRLLPTEGKDTYLTIL